MNESEKNGQILSTEIKFDVIESIANAKNILSLVCNHYVTHSLVKVKCVVQTIESKHNRYHWSPFCIACKQIHSKKKIEFIRAFVSNAKQLNASRYEKGVKRTLFAVCHVRSFHNSFHLNCYMNTAASSQW